MLPEKYRWITVQFEPEGDPRLLFAIAQQLEDEGNLEGAATVYDRAYGLDPAAADVCTARGRVLDQLAVVEHGICFRYIPEGPFLMGNHTGEADENPLHPVWLSPCWLSETPVSWATYCRLMDWQPPPAGFPRQEGPPPQGHDPALFHLREENKIRLQYCENHTIRARDWHAHDAGGGWRSGNRTGTGPEIFGAPERSDPQAPWRYDTKPMVSVSWQSAQEMAERMSTPEIRYALPTEAQWEKGARGGLIGVRYAWGDEPPSDERCDFNRFHAFSILPMTAFAPNGYGLYAMNGGVWEWTRDWYDRDYYRVAPETDPDGPAQGEEKVLRGGSWSDCADVITVTYRMSRMSSSWRGGTWGQHLAPNIGFRLCRKIACAGMTL